MSSEGEGKAAEDQTDEGEIKLKRSGPVVDEDGKGSGEEAEQGPEANSENLEVQLGAGKQYQNDNGDATENNIAGETTVNTNADNNVTESDAMDEDNEAPVNCDAMELDNAKTDNSPVDANENNNGSNENEKGDQEQETTDDSNEDKKQLGGGDDKREEGKDGNLDEDNENESIRSTGTMESRAQNESKLVARYDIPDYLDRTTVNAIKAYLIDFDGIEELDEDEVVQLMTKTNVNVEHRARYYSKPLDDFVDEERMHRDFKTEEEEYLVGHDFMKEMTSSLNTKRRRGLDKRTVNWIKRAAGLNRKDYHSPHSALGQGEGAEVQGGGRKAPRRYTRGMAKTTRIKKQEEFVFKDELGIRSLLDAIEELEPQCGPFPIPFECHRTRTRDKPRPAARKKTVMRGSEDESIKPERRFDPTTMRPLVARISEEDSLHGQERNRNFVFGDNRDILVTKIIVGGDHVSEDESDRMSIRERKRELKRLRDRQYQKRKRDQKLAARGETRQLLPPKTRLNTPVRSNTKRRTRDYDSETDEDQRPRRKPRPTQGASTTRKRLWKGPVSLPLMDWQRRQIWTPGKKAKKDVDNDVHASLSIPAHLRRSGIGYRLPPWESVNPASNISDQANHAEPLRKRHSDDVYSLWCHKLINCLNGGARSWAIKEFFYSDIDKPFYNANPFAREVAKLGILPNAKLTRKEWSLVRRITHKRPRRFSKRFILSQLRERNKFRNMVRRLQGHPDETNHTGFAIPAPIRVGATVTAYNKKFLILHRGVVLYHDFLSAKYLVQFERKELGYEFCSDTEVASHGVPDILMPASLSRLSGSPHEEAGGSFADAGTLPYGTSFGPLSVAKAKEAVTCEREVSNLLGGRKQSSSYGDNNEDEARAVLVEKVAERETLVTLMSIIETATKRKAMLLDVMEKFSALLVDRLPFGEGPPSNHVISGYFEQHFAWLRANLETTNSTLSRAVGFMKVMYGKAYSSVPESSLIRQKNMKDKFIETMLTQERRLCGGPPSATLHWIAALHHGSNDVGTYLSSLVLQENALLDDDGRAISVATSDQLQMSSGTFLRSRIAAAGSLLSVIGYCCGRQSESTVTLPDGDPPLIDVVLASSVANLPCPEVPEVNMDGVLKDALAERDVAKKELKEAFALLGQEFTGLSFAGSLGKLPV